LDGTGRKYRAGQKKTHNMCFKASCEDDDFSRLEIDERIILKRILDMCLCVMD
jgi:hypothetical protein